MTKNIDCTDQKEVELAQILYNEVVTKPFNK